MSELSPRVRFWVGIAIPAFGIVLAILFLEIAFRVLTKGKKPATWSDRPFAAFVGTDVVRIQDGPAASKSTGTYRISVVGDSFTFGPHLQLDDTFPKRLERYLNLNNGAPKVEVFNRGFSGYSTVGEVEVVKNAIRDQSDLVILEITLNDAEPHILSAEERRALFDSPYLRSPLFRVWRSLGFVVSRLHNNSSYSSYIDYHSKFWKEEATFKAFDGALTQMAEAASRNNVKLAAVVFPLFDFPFDSAYPFKDVHKIIHGALRAHGIRFVDLRAAYRGIPNDRLQVIPGDDSHPNEIAHRIAAERLLSFLATQKLVPAEAIPQKVYRERRDFHSRSANPARVWDRGVRGLSASNVPETKDEDLDMAENGGDPGTNEGGDATDSDGQSAVSE